MAASNRPDDHRPPPPVGNSALADAVYDLLSRIAADALATGVTVQHAVWDAWDTNVRRLCVALERENSSTGRLASPVEEEKAWQQDRGLIIVKADDATHSSPTRTWMYNLQRAKQEIDVVAKHTTDLTEYVLSLSDVLQAADTRFEASIAALKKDLLGAIDAKFAELQRSILGGDEHSLETSAIGDLEAKVALLRKDRGSEHAQPVLHEPAGAHDQVADNAEAHPQPIDPHLDHHDGHPG